MDIACKPKFANLCSRRQDQTTGWKLWGRELAEKKNQNYREMEEISQEVRITHFSPKVFAPLVRDIIEELKGLIEAWI